MSCTKCNKTMEIGDKVKIICTDCFNKISDLETKLAELREQITILDEENSKTFMKSVNAWRENAELKQQLAEKEKEIKDRINQVRTLYVQLYELQKAVEYCQEHHKKNKLTPLTLHNYTNEQHSQDKISFAVEQLEKVLVLIHNAVNIDSPEYDLVGLYDAVSNQIKAIKEMK